MNFEERSQRLRLAAAQAAKNRVKSKCLYYITLTTPPLSICMCSYIHTLICVFICVCVYIYFTLYTYMCIYIHVELNAGVTSSVKKVRTRVIAGKAARSTA